MAVCAARRSDASCASACSRSRTRLVRFPASMKYWGNVLWHSSHFVTPVSRHHLARHSGCTWPMVPWHLHGLQNGV